MTLTQEQKTQLQTLTMKWNAQCVGTYDSTFVAGVAHGYCDSGILTDGLSERDLQQLSKYFTGETIYTNVDLDTLTEWLRQLTEDDTLQLDCTRFVAEVMAVLTEEQQLHADTMEAGDENAVEVALNYCWECCEHTETAEQV